MSDTEIIRWYDTLWAQSIEESILNFCMYLLKKGEFDTLPQKNKIIYSILKLSKKFPQERSKEIEAYFFYSINSFYQTLYSEVNTLLDILDSGDITEVDVHLKIIVDFIHK